MKRKLLLLAMALAALFCLMAFSVSAEEATLPAKCEHCNKAVTWTPLTEDNVEDTVIAAGHYYLAFEGESLAWATKNVPRKVCIYMNGKTVSARSGVARALTVSGELSLIGEGTVMGRGFADTSSFGGSINVTGTLNVYGTTVTTTGEEGRTAGRGGVVYLSGANSVLNLHSGSIIGGTAANGATLGIDTGVANIYGGTIQGGTATAAGGAVYIRSGGTLNMMGGTIQGGTASTTGGAIYAHTNSFLNITGGTITGGNSTKNGGTLYVNTVNAKMSGGTLGGGYSGNAGGSVYINKGGILDISGGKITTGEGKATGDCVYMPAESKLILSGSASVAEVQLNAYDPARILVKGKCTGAVTFRGPSGEAVDGKVIGVAEEGADLHSASYGIYNTELYVIHKGTDLVVSSISYVDHVQTRRAYCRACGKFAQWMSYNATEYENNTYIYSGHYYIDSEEDVCNWKLKYIVGSDHVCLDLMGKTLMGSSRAFDLTKGTLNVFDSVGGGQITACGPTNVETVYGGTIFIREPSTLNLFGGKLTYTLPTDGRSYVARGGVAYVRGALNVYGGEISGGAAKAGGNIYADAASTYVGHIGLYGGIVGGNVKVPGASTSGPCIVTRGTLTLSGDPQVNAIMMGNNDYTPALSQRVTVKGVFTGSAVITISEYANEADIGTAVNADLSGANVTFTHDAQGRRLVAMNGELLLVKDAPAAILITETSSVAYATAAEAIDAAGETDIVMLLADTANLTIDKLVNVDLNGHNIDGATGTGTLYCMDSATSDFTVADGVYGKLTNVACLFDGMRVDGDQYLMVNENGQVSFHRLQLAITGAVLRPSAAGLYYKSLIRGDELVTAKVTAVGIALNTAEVPSQANLTSTSLYTRLGAEHFNTAGNSCLLDGIMKTENGDDVNLLNAATRVYASAYVEWDGGLYFGETYTTNLQEQVSAINGSWTPLTLTQKRSFMNMFYNFESVMRDASWSVSNAVSIADRKTLFETTDYTPYLCPWNYDVVEAAKADGKIHYYFFAGEGLHISDTQTYKDKWGDAYLVVFPNGQTLLVDTGPLAYAPVLAKNLEMMGIKHLDAILVTHPHSDHHNGAFSDSAYLNIGLLDKITVGNVYYRGGWDPESATVDLVSRVCRDLNIPCHVMDKGDVLYFGDAKLECVWPLEGEGNSRISGGEEINNMSIVVRIDFGEHSSLLTGDLYTAGEKYMMERVDNSLLDVDLLKVPHHGYNTSSSVALLETVSPELAVSVGRLPIPKKVYDRYAALGIPFLDDRACGYVEVVAQTDGTMTYTTTRSDSGTTAPDTGDEDIVPDEDEA